MLGQQAVPAPHAAYAGRDHLQAFEHQLLGDAQGAVAGMGQAVLEDRLLDLGGHPVGVGRAGARHAVEQPVGAVGLEVAADLVELLAGIAHHLAGLADVPQVAREFEQAQLAPCYLLVRGHVVLLFGFGRCVPMAAH